MTLNRQRRRGSIMRDRGIEDPERLYRNASRSLGNLLLKSLRKNGHVPHNPCHFCI